MWLCGLQTLMEACRICSERVGRPPRAPGAEGTRGKGKQEKTDRGFGIFKQDDQKRSQQDCGIKARILRSYGSETCGNVKEVCSGQGKADAKSQRQS